MTPAPPPVPTAGPPGWTGGQVTSRARCVLAANPGPMTLEGTNTWVLAEPGADQAVVVDPGPLDEAHLRRVLSAVEEVGARVALVVLTHGHPDHAEGAARLAELTGAPVRALALDPDRSGAFGGLHDGDDPSVGGLALSVVATPGHTADSLCLLLPADEVLLTGDTVLGRGTTVVAHPDGELGAYLWSLQRIAALVASGAVRRILPGHGPVVEDPGATVRHYVEHRAQRLDAVRAALAAGDVTADQVLARVYAGVPRQVWPAARQSVLAQLAYLEQ